MKTDIDIKDDVYNILIDSNLGSMITGVITKRKREEDSQNEDIVISVLANQNGQRQEAFVNVNIYVPDLVNQTRYEEDTIRLRELCREAHHLFECINEKDYRITLDSQRVFEVGATNEHMINNKLLYQTINEDRLCQR